MSRIAYVNGRYVPHARASVHVEDRGYQFADGVYEVIAITSGQFVDFAPHLDRLERSLAALRIAMPMGRRALEFVLTEVVRRNGVADGMLYLQVTRGVARRDHPFPAAAKPALVITAKRLRQPASLREQGVAVVSVPDQRWKRCDIKSIALLPNVLGKQQARESGAFEAWMIDEAGLVTEGTSSNAWIVLGDGTLVTREVSPAILAGITRATVLELAGRAQMKVELRAFTLAEAKAAAEAFLTSTTGPLLPVVRIDGQPVGEGRPGPVTRRLRQMYDDHVRTLP